MWKSNVLLASLKPFISKLGKMCQWPREAFKMKKGKMWELFARGRTPPPSMEIPCLWGFFGFILHLIPFSWNFFPEWAFSDQIDQISPPSNCTTCFSISERFWHAKNQVSFQIKCDLRRPPSLLWRNSHIFLFFFIFKVSSTGLTKRKVCYLLALCNCIGSCWSM